ncbi:serine hydrolase domain-containing protein [Streptomyces sp. NBC_00989]|uniref:serine hydrolase domain-containing protein n=1 Tax=Streptomyces sp. NBC_00989 TaxID=2903705 RepID=UPI00386B0D50|nr:beta-lactamase family protein [Streptomyces sp. NBC_00989]
MPRNTPYPRPARRAHLTLALAAVLTGALTACTAATAAQDTASASAGRTGVPAAEEARLATLAQQVVDAGAPGVLVRVDNGRGQATSIARQASWARDEHTLTVNDEFRMGSNTKTMVATVVLQLVAEHRLKLTDPVEKWLPGLIPNGSAITLRMLLDHTSGLYNIIPGDAEVLKTFTGQDNRPWTPEELLAAGVRHDPLFPPGTKYSYSNTGYIALGLVVEKATGHRLSDLVQERIAGPLQLRNTYLVNSADRARSPRLAHGYEPGPSHLAPVLWPGIPAGTVFVGPARPGGYIDASWINENTEWAAGSMVSSAQDWARFDTALMSGKLLPAAQLKEMKTTVAEESGNPNRYGLGLEKKATPCGTVWGHDGQAPGYSSWAYADDTGRRTVSVQVPTIFGIAAPEPAAATEALLNAAVCTMLGTPIPAKAPSTPTG